MLSPLSLIAAILLLILLLTFIQVGALTIAFGKLGLSTESGFLLLFSSLLGSAVNLPLLTVKSDPPPPDAVPQFLRSMVRDPRKLFNGKTRIAMNVGGGLIPVAFSAYLMRYSQVDVGLALVGTALVAMVCYFFSRPIAGLGIGMPVFVAPVTAAVIAVALGDEQQSPALAYICGTLGVLIGADLLRLKDVRKMGAPMASIGGAGTFDGIFITGIVAVLLA